MKQEGAHQPSHAIFDSDAPDVRVLDGHLINIAVRHIVDTQGSGDYPDEEGVPKLFDYAELEELEVGVDKHVKTVEAEIPNIYELAREMAPHFDWGDEEKRDDVVAKSLNNTLAKLNEELEEDAESDFLAAAPNDFLFY